MTGYLNGIVVVAHHSHTRVSDQTIVDAKVASNNAGIGLVAVLCFQSETLTGTLSFCAVAAGIGVSVNLNESLARCHSLQTSAGSYMNSTHGGTTIFAFGTLLQLQRV